LGDTDDLVRRSDLFGLVGRACGHQTDNFHLVVIALQHGANAFQRQAHVDVEVFRVIWRQIVGVRIVRHGEGVDVRLEDIFAAGLIEARQLILVALGQQFLNFRRLLAGNLQTQDFVLDAFAPQIIELGFGLEPWSFLAVDLQAFLGFKVQRINTFVQLGKGEVQTRLDAIQIALVDDETGVEVAAFEEVVKLVLPLVKFGNVACQKVTARRVQQLQVAVIDDRRAGVIQWRLAVMMALEQLNNVKTGNYLITIGLKVIPTVSGKRIGRKRQNA